ncbi:hypothetical protein ACFQ1I_25650 [Kitasatospora arboriphila]
MARSRSRAGSPSRAPTRSGRPSVRAARAPGARARHQAATSPGPAPGGGSSARSAAFSGSRGSDSSAEARHRRGWRQRPAVPGRRGQCRQPLGGRGVRPLRRRDRTRGIARQRRLRHREGLRRLTQRLLDERQLHPGRLQSAGGPVDRGTRQLGGPALPAGAVHPARGLPGPRLVVPLQRGGQGAVRGRGGGQFGRPGGGQRGGVHLSPPG